MRVLTPMPLPSACSRSHRSRALPLLRAALATLLAVPAARAAAAPVTISNPRVALACVPATGTCTLRWPDGTQAGPLAAAVELTDGRRWLSTDLPRHRIALNRTTGELTLRSYGAPHAPELRQHLRLSATAGAVEMELEVLSSQPVSTRHIAPLVLAQGGSLHLAAGGRPTVLFVPFDNDMWVHYNEPIDPARDPDSYEVTAIFDNASRKGLVLGSITHDTWRTGILARNLGERNVGQLEVYGGATGHWTHDVEPHGAVTGTAIRSPRVLLGYFADWRDGLEAYGRRNAEIKPPLPWSDGVPFGWNSWAAYLQKIDRAKYDANADFIRTELMPHGYQNHQTTYINWDGGWNDVSEAEVAAAPARLHAHGQKAGIYYTPFSYWSDDLTKVVEGTNGKYRYSDIVLRDSHGQPLPKVDGARPLDPTHPGTIARIDWELARFVAWGYDSVKLDFLNCGSLEGVHWDPKITTGVAAYNYGMQRVEADLAPQKIGRPFFLSLSIAPLFPAYGHARRISCDAFGRIQDSDYLLNAATYSWWSNGTLYQFNDPDHTVIARDKDPYHDQSLPGSVQSLDEARSRVNATVIAGTLMLDSDDLMSPYGQQRARQLLTNPAVLEVARAGRSFRPVEGDTGTHASNLFTRQESDGSLLLAAFNFQEAQPLELPVRLARLGLQPGVRYTVVDLWSGQSTAATVEQDQLTLQLAPGASRLLRLQPVAGR
ncbi:MAG: alpha-galactosidase [Acidobacteriota bacterium]|nr:alpha-galactosidase [Acidobacteriota bacterium]